MAQEKLAILVGGGPAPGINAVIGAATIHAVNHGLSVTGIYEGFRQLAKEGFNPREHTVELTIPDVARIHFDGGSILRTARHALLDEQSLGGATKVIADNVKVERVLKHLAEMGISYLITIGGDDTALSARFLAETGQGAVRVIHVPKTIDNDLPIASDYPTFGFSTARHHGSLLVANLMEDSRTTTRWYLATTMGRHAGFLALGIGVAAGATVSLIPEEFPERITVRDIADVLEGSILKRRTMGRHDGVAVIAEGLAYRLGSRDELETLLGKDLPVDAAGHLRLSEIPLGRILKEELRRRFADRGDKLAVVDLQLGYELRCAPPTPFDMAYCRTLGHDSIRLLLESATQLYRGSMVSLQGGNITPVYFEDIINPQTNRIRTRTVDLDSDLYRVALAYMIRLGQNDFTEPSKLNRLAAEARMTPNDFFARYASMAGMQIEQPDMVVSND